MDARLVNNWSCVDYALCKRLQQMHAGDAHWWHRPATALSLVPLAFDTALNFVIDTLYFLKDGAAGLGRIAQARWQRQPLSPLKVSFGQFISFCKEHFAFTYTCAEVLVKGLVLSWWHPQRYIETLPDLSEQRAAQRLRPIDAYEKTFAQCLALYRENLHNLPARSPLYAQGLKILVGSLSVTELLDESIREFNQLISTLPAQAFAHQQEAGELLYALYRLPQATRKRIHLAELCQKMDPLVAVTAIAQLFEQHRTAATGSCPPIVQLQQFNDLQTFLESFATFAHNSEIAEGLIALATRKAALPQHALLAHHIANIFEHRGSDVSAVRMHQLPPRLQEEAEAIQTIRFQKSPGLFEHLTQACVSPWPQGLPSIILQYVALPHTPLTLSLCVENWMNSPPHNVREVEELHLAAMQCANLGKYRRFEQALLWMLLQTENLLPSVRQKVLRLLRCISNRIRDDLTQVIDDAIGKMHSILDKTSHLVPQQLPSAVRTIGLAWETLRTWMSARDSLLFFQLSEEGNEADAPGIKILKRMASLDYQWLMQPNVQLDAEDIRLLDLRTSHYHENAHLLFTAAQLQILNKHMRARINTENSAQAAIVLSLFRLNAQDLTNDLDQTIALCQEWTEATSEQRKNIEPHLILCLAEVVFNSETDKNRVLLKPLANFMLKEEAAAPHSIFISWLQNQFERLSLCDLYRFIQNPYSQNIPTPKNLITRILEAHSSRNLETLQLPPAFHLLLFPSRINHDGFLVLLQRIREGLQSEEIEKNDAAILTSALLDTFKAFLQTPKGQEYINQEQWKMEILKEIQWLRTYSDAFISQNLELTNPGQILATGKAFIHMASILMRVIAIEPLLTDALQVPLGQRSSSPAAHTPP